MERTFLTTEWRKLIIANYMVDPAVLKKYVPYGTKLEERKGNHYVSLVGFMFINTKVLGVKIPFHVNFEEVNLRFYVVSNDKCGDFKRGVVFIKEIVSRPMLSLVAKTFFKENYHTMPMKHTWLAANNSLHIEYTWMKKVWHVLHVKAEKTPCEMTVGSEEEFITDHYWGYTKIDQSRTSQYKVEHPPWQIYPVKDYAVNVDFGVLYGASFDFLNYSKPCSVLLAEGSEVVVKTPSQNK